MSTQINSIINCLGKSLKTEIKSIAISKVTILDVSNIEILKQKSKQVICLGVKRLFILQGDLKRLLEYIDYEEIEGLEIDNKNYEIFTIWLKGPSIGSRHKIKRIIVQARYRGVLIKNMICYYSIYYQLTYGEIRDIKLAISNYDNQEEIKEKLGIKKGLSRIYKQLNSKGYEYYVKYFIIENYNNSTLNICFEDEKEREVKVEKERTDKHEKGKEKEKTETNREGFEISVGDNCILNIDISEIYHFSQLEREPNSKDIIFYSTQYMLDYLRTFGKAKRFKIIKSKIFNKKYNLNEDNCMWEGWRLEVRVSDPNYINYVFIVLRRKFLPPFYDSFQNFHFILSEGYERETPVLNNKSYEIIELAANTINYSNKTSDNNDYNLFLNLKMESLISDEETILFFQNSLNIIPKEIYELGFKFILSLLVYLENSINDKLKIRNIRQVVEGKVKALKSSETGFDLEFSEISGESGKLMLTVSEIVSLYKPNENIEKLKNTLAQINDESSKETINYDKDKMNTKVKERDEIVKELVIERRKIEVWKSKCFRFFTFCMNGGISDYMFTMEMFFDILNRLQNLQVNSELNELIFYLLNITDCELDSIEEPPKLYIPSLNERSIFKFNENLMCMCIKSGWLSKYLSDNIKHCPTFIKLLLKNHLSNRLLNSITGYLKSLNDLVGEDNLLNEERNSFSMLLKPLVEIYADIRKNPTTVILAAKAICFLINKKGDKRNIIILIQEDIVPKIMSHIDNSDYDEKLLLISMELFIYIIPELKTKINEYLLSDLNGVNIIKSLKSLLKGTKVPGCYFTQRVQSQVIEVFNRLTNILEAGLKERLTSYYELSIYDNLLELVDEEKKNLYIDVNEEISYAFEKKIFNFLSIMVLNNDKLKEYLNKKLVIKNFFERKANSLKSLLTIVLNGIKYKDGFTDNKVSLINDTIEKYFEFFYNYIVKDEEKVNDYKNNGININQLLILINKNRNTLGINKDFDVYKWIEVLYGEGKKLNTIY